MILPHFLGVSGDFRVGKDLEVLGDTILHDFIATDGSMNDLSVNRFHLVNDGYVKGTLEIDGSMVLNGKLIFTGNAEEIGTVSISGDASYNGFLYGSKNLYLGSKHQQDDLSNQGKKFIQATKSSMSTDDSYSMCFGKDISAGNQGQLSYYHNSDDSSRNTVTLGVFGKNNIAINSNGHVSIGRPVTTTDVPSSLDVSGTVTISAQSNYIYTTPSLQIDNTSRNDTTGASLKLIGKRNYWSENKPNNEYPYLTGADIIFENVNDANPSNSNNAAKKQTTKIHGVIKTFQTDNSWNIGDMAFYGQDISSLYAGTDTSGITEFMRFDAADQFVRFSKDVGIGGVKGDIVNMTPVISHALPQYPDPSAVLDLRTYTYYGETGRPEQPDWKGGNILLAPENKTGNNLDIPNGLIWKPLAGEITSGNTFEYNYTKESAGIKFMPAANFYRGGLAFFTNNTADVSTNAVERMRIDQGGNVGIGTSSPSSTLDVSGSTNITGTATIDGQLVVPMIDVTQPNQSSSFSGTVQIINDTSYNFTSNNDPALFVEGGVKINDKLGVSGEVRINSGVINLTNLQTRLRNDNGTDIAFITHNIERMRIDDSGNVYIPEKVGIGTTGPVQKLDVSGNANITGNLYLGDTSKGLINGYKNRILSLHSSNKPRLSVMNNGHVSIGNNFSGDSLDAPALLTIGHPLTSNTNHNNTSFDGGTKILLGNEGSNTNNKYVIGFGAFNANVLDGNTHYPPAYIGYEQVNFTGNTGHGDLIFGTRVSNQSTVEAQERMRIISNGYVGIGTSDPDYPLDVYGQTRVQGGLEVATDLTVGGNTTLTGSANINSSTTFNGTTNFTKDTTIQGDLTTSNITINGNAAVNGNINAAGQQIECKFINTTNNVGIGQNYDGNNMFTVVGDDATTNPSLSVNRGTVAINAKASDNSGYKLYVDGSSNLVGVVNIAGELTLNGTNLTTLINNSHSSEGYALLNSSPNFTGTVHALSFNATSDENKKEDIETISDATEKLTSLRGVSYKLKEEEEKKTHYGVVAQEIERIFPDMVSGEEGNKSVAYMEIIGVLIETVKDLNKRIQKLEESSK